jgi:hypothetical protein
VSSLAAIEPRSSIDSFCDLVDEAIAALEKAFGAVLLFEHGGAFDAVTTSQCVAHAHLHLWAIADRVELSVSQETTRFDSVRDFLHSSAPWSKHPYTLMSDGNGVAIGPDPGIKQFFRRQIAQQLGREDEWDYGAFAFEGAMRETVDRVQGVL